MYLGLIISYNKIKIDFKKVAVIIIDSCLTSDAVPIKVYADYCRNIDTKNLQGEHEW